MWPRTVQAKKRLLYFIIWINTFLIFLDLFVLMDGPGALIAFLTCAISWLGILALDRLEELEAQSKSKRLRHQDESDEDKKE
jgi:hypothetical protein